MSEVSRLRNGLNIRRPKSKANIMNASRVKSCLVKFDNGSYSRLQFLRAVSHCMGAHTAALQPADSDSDDDDGDDRQSTAATTFTAPHTAAADADACTTTWCMRGDHVRSLFRGTRRGARVGTLRPCALLRVLRKPRCRLDTYFFAFQCAFRNMDNN